MSTTADESNVAFLHRCPPPSPSSLNPSVYLFVCLSVSQPVYLCVSSPFRFPLSSWKPGISRIISRRAPQEAQEAQDTSLPQQLRRSEQRRQQTEG